MKLIWAFILLFSLTPFSGQILAAPAGTSVAKADDGTIYIKKRKMPLNVLYKSVLLAFENNGYFVTSEHNIGKSMQPFAQRWGKSYNRNKIEEIRSMVLSNPWYANNIANADPVLLAMFPLHVTLIQKGKYTTILFVRPSKVAYQSRGQTVAEELEKDVIRIFENII